MGRFWAEPSRAGRRPIDVNRTRWVLAGTVVAVLAVVIGVAVVLNRDTAGSSSSQRRQAFAFDAAYAEPDPMVLIVRYGDSSSCPSEGVRPAVVQQPDRIIVTLTREPMPGDRACTSDYGAKLVRIPLTTPLDGRTVIDASRTTPVPISTGLPPFG